MTTCGQKNCCEHNIDKTRDSVLLFCLAAHLPYRFFVFITAYCESSVRVNQNRKLKQCKVYKTAHIIYCRDGLKFHACSSKQADGKLVMWASVYFKISIIATLKEHENIVKLQQRHGVWSKVNKKTLFELEHRGTQPRLHLTIYCYNVLSVFKLFLDDFAGNLDTNTPVLFHCFGVFLNLSSLSLPPPPSYIPNANW